MLTTATALSAGNLAVQLIGIVRIVLIAAILGAAEDADRYYFLLAIVSLLGVLAHNVAQSCFLGRFTELRQADEGDAERYFTIALVLFGATGLIAGAALGMFIELRTDFATALIWLAPVVLTSVIADFVTTTLQALERFRLFLLAPLANATVAAGTLYFWTDPNLEAVCLSLLIGSGVQLALLLPFVVSQISRADLSEVTRHAGEELRTLLYLALPLIPALLLFNGTLVIVQSIALQLGEGAASSIGYAHRIYTGIAQLVVFGIGSVLLPFFARSIAEADPHRTRSAMRAAIRGTPLLCIPLTVAVLLFGAPLIDLLLERGRFDSSHSAMVALCLGVLSLALAPYALGTFIAKYFNAARETHLILKSAFVGFAGALLGAGLGIYLQSVEALSLSFVLCFGFTLLFWLRELSASGISGSHWGDIARSSALGLVLAGLATGAVWLIREIGLDPTRSVLPFMLECGVFAITIAILIAALRLPRWIASD